MKLVLVSLLLLAAPAMAEESRLTVAAPKCDAAAIRTKGGEGVQDVKAAEWMDGYYVTFDAARTDKAKITAALYKAGCF